MKRLLKRCINFIRRTRKIYQLKKSIKRLNEIKLILGSGNTSQEGWLSTNKDILDITKESDWDFLFRTDSISQMLAEHVWEHLTQEAAIVTAKNCFKHLRPGGHLRVAVPDGYHPDEDYIMYVKPGGIGPGCEDHKVLYTYKSFRDVFLSAGFKVNLLEYWDEDGKFHYNSWNVQEGAIMRSRDFDNRNKSKELSYTSIILDAIKEKP